MHTRKYLFVRFFFRTDLKLIPSDQTDFNWRNDGKYQREITELNTEILEHPGRESCLFETQYWPMTDKQRKPQLLLQNVTIHPKDEFCKLY
jgi:hypothetical protein